MLMVKTKAHVHYLELEVNLENSSAGSPEVYVYGWYY